MNLVAVLEGLLFVSGEEGLSVEKLKEVLEVDNEQLSKLVEKLHASYFSSDRGLRLDVLGNRLKLTTKKEHKSFYQKLVANEELPLSQAALETLAIIAYNEPITRGKIDEIRGISSGHLVRKLLARNLIKEVGRSELPGRPYLYGVTNEFLDYFGLSSTKELPPLEEEIEELDEIDLFTSKYQEEIEKTIETED